MNRGKVSQKLDPDPAIARQALVTRSDRFKSTLLQKSDPAISEKTATSVVGGGNEMGDQSGGRNGVRPGKPRRKFSRVGEAAARVLGRDSGPSNLLWKWMNIDT